MIPFALKGGIKKKRKKTLLLLPAKMKRSQHPSSSGWRFNLSPDKWPTASLPEAAQSGRPESTGNRVEECKSSTVRRDGVTWSGGSTGEKTRQNNRGRFRLECVTMQHRKSELQSVADTERHYWLRMELSGWSSDVYKFIYTLTHTCLVFMSEYQIPTSQITHKTHKIIL